MHKYLNIRILYFSVIITGILFVFFLFLKKDRSDHNPIGFDSPGEFAKYFHDISAPPGAKFSGYGMNYRYEELTHAKNNFYHTKKNTATLNWVQRGPGNVGGRTRSLIVDPDDLTHKTWYAGSASGGIWKTTNGGVSWQDLSPDFPNLSTSALAMANSNHNIIYAGTGEGYGAVGMVSGSGIFRSVNRGNSWIQLPSTIQNDDFEFVNVLVIDPVNENIVIAGTNKGIFKSINGGDTWIKVYSEGYWVQDIVANTEDFNILYAGAYGLGILKSVNAGDSWTHSFNGIGEGGRFHLAISPVNPKKIFTSVEAYSTETGALQTHIYVSPDEGQNWNKFISPGNFLGNQGWFNNIIEVHPFNDNIVYVAGVDFGKIEFKSGTSSSDPQVLRVDTFNTAGFMQFVGFGGDFLGGGMATGDKEDGVDISSGDWSSVEIRFGPGIWQKAHRFTVPEGEGAGVPPEEYSYRDYVDVPFQAWDTDNNRQLAISFRDQERDGKFNLIERDIDDDISGREYFFVHAIDYNPSAPDANITIAGGHTYKQLYFFWPELTPDSVWNENSLPVAKIDIDYGTFSLINEESITTVLADYRKNDNLHVDHHEIIPIITDTVNKIFTILEANDGGLGISYNEGKTWEQIKSGYVTTQFYGVAKRPGFDEFIGGMQDNGTWQSPISENASVSSVYDDKIGGDGFEVLWHPIYSKRIIGSSYNNYFYVSADGGETWSNATSGIMNGDGPFVSRLSNSPQNPDILFAVGRNGVYRHKNFGLGRFEWETIPIGDGWTINETVLSTHNVRVSLANDSVVWAGAGMYNDPDLHLFLSKNGGNSFDSVPDYKEVTMGYISGIATHPADKKTAYILFSLKDKPKIIRTTDFGQSWQDITGFGVNEESTNGFPDVMVNCLLVMPNKTNMIWAGTEIGIFESVDNGASWYFADNGLPAVSIWQMFVQDNVIVVGTHGRGIWTVNLDDATDIDDADINTGTGVTIFPNPNTGKFNLSFTGSHTGNFGVKIYDTQGKIVYSENYFKTGSKFEKDIVTEDLNKGTYILIIDQKKNQLNGRFIVR